MGARKAKPEPILTADLGHEYYWFCPHCRHRNARESKWTDDTCDGCGKPVHLQDCTYDGDI